MTIQTTPVTEITGSGASPIVTEANTTVDSPVVLPPEPTPVPVIAVPEATPEPTQVPDPNKVTPDWAQKRINELTAKRYEAERVAQEAADRAKAAETRTIELLKQIEKGGAPQPTAIPIALGEDEIEKRALEKARFIAQANEFNRACNSIADIGKKEYKESWDDAMRNLGMVGAIGKDTSPEFLENAIELKDPHKVLHYLGTHMDEGARIAGLSGRKMALELARLESHLNAPTPAPTQPPVSQAPPPVIPVGGAAKNGPVSLDDPNTSSADWFKTRQAQIEEKRNRYRRA